MIAVFWNKLNIFSQLIKHGMEELNKIDRSKLAGRNSREKKEKAKEVNYSRYARPWRWSRRRPHPHPCTPSFSSSPPPCLSRDQRCCWGWGYKSPSIFLSIYLADIYGLPAYVLKGRRRTCILIRLLAIYIEVVPSINQIRSLAYIWRAVAGLNRWFLIRISRNRI